MDGGSAVVAVLESGMVTEEIEAGREKTLAIEPELVFECWRSVGEEVRFS
jgi:hypothetical protein